MAVSTQLSENMFHQPCRRFQWGCKELGMFRNICSRVKTFPLCCYPKFIFSWNRHLSFQAAFNLPQNKAKHKHCTYYSLPRPLDGLSVYHVRLRQNYWRVVLQTQWFYSYGKLSGEASAHPPFLLQMREWASSTQPRSSSWREATLGSEHCFGDTTNQLGWSVDKLWSTGHRWSAALNGFYKLETSSTVTRSLVCRMSTEWTEMKNTHSAHAHQKHGWVRPMYTLHHLLILWPLCHWNVQNAFPPRIYKCRNYILTQILLI